MERYEALEAEHGEHRLSVNAMGVICENCGEYIIDADDEDRTQEVVALEQQLAGAVDALREWLDADDAAEADFTDETERRLDAAIDAARAIVGGR